MKKSIVALAVTSAAFASISAHAAEDTTVGFYGNIQYAYEASNPKEDGLASTNDLIDNGSSLGFKGTSKVTDTTTAFFNFKYKVPLNSKASYSVSMDNAEVGLKGNFGKVQVGSFDSIYNDAIQDPINQFEYLGLQKGKTSPEGKTVAYYSPSLSGFQVQVSASTGSKSADDGSNGATATKTDANYTGVLKYSMDAVTVSLGYDGLESQSSNYGSTTGFAVTYTGVDNLSVTLNSENTTNGSSAGNQKGQKSIGLAARYSYGMGDVYGSYQRVKPNDTTSSKDYNEYGVGVSYNINSAMYVYAELGQTNTTYTDSSTSSSVTELETKQSIVGVVYSF